jgi:integrase
MVPRAARRAVRGPAGPTSSASPGTWRPGAGPGRRCRGGWPRSPGSTGAPSRKTCSITPRAAHVRRPRLDYESHAIGLDRNEVGATLVAAGLGSAAEHALISLLALNGLRVSEAVSSDIEALAVQRGHRTLSIVREGGKRAVVRLAPRTARAIDLAIGERCEGPIFLTTAGNRMDRHGAGRIVRRVARRAGLGKPIGPHTLRHAFITAAQVGRIASDATFPEKRDHDAAGAAGRSCGQGSQHP